MYWYFNHRRNLFSHKEISRTIIPNLIIHVFTDKRQTNVIELCKLHSVNVIIHSMNIHSLHLKTVTTPLLLNVYLCRQQGNFNQGGRSLAYAAQSWWQWDCGWIALQVFPLSIPALPFHHLFFLYLHTDIVFWLTGSMCLQMIQTARF